MISNFLLVWSKQNFLFLSFEKQEKLVNSKVLKETVIYCEYKKSKEEYQIRKHLLNQIIKKTLSIKKALYLGYLLLFLFNNTTSYLLQIVYISKKLDSQKLFLRPA